MGIAGNLKTMELAELLQWLSQGQKTGTLVVTQDDREKRVFFQNGRIISSASTDPKEHLGHFLVSHGFITEQQLAEAVRRQESEKSLLGKILIGMEAITPEQLDHMLRMKAEEGIYELFSWPEGEFRFLDDNLPDYEMVPLSLEVVGLVLEAMRRQDEFKRIKMRIPSPLCVPVRMMDDLAEDPELGEGQRFILQAIDDDRSIEDIALHTHASEYYVCEAIFPLVMARKVKIVRPRGASASAEPAVSGQASGTSLLRRGERHLAAHELEPALRYLRAARNLEPDNQTIQLAAERGERSIRELLQREGVVPDAVPRLAIPIEEIMHARVSPKAGFLLSRVDGKYDIASILKISPMAQLEALLLFRELAQAGLVRIGRR
jgi:hypothetical protein